MPDKISDAKKVLANADAFQKSAGGPLKTPVHASAPYSIVAKARQAASDAAAPSRQAMDEAKETGESIKSNQENAHAAGLN